MKWEFSGFEDAANGRIHLTQGTGKTTMTNEEAQVTAKKPPTVLLIDDNAIQAATRQTILRRAGYFAIAALNPQRALEQLQADGFPGEIEAVITDHIMPGMSGSAFVRELRKTHTKLPVMVISGLEEAEEEYIGLTVVFLLKPVPPESLLAHLRQLMGEPEAEAGAA